MNIKAYIDYFDEISDLPREKQFTVLEEAQKLIQEEGVVSKFALISLLVPILSIGILVSGGILLFSNSLVVIAICFIFGLLVSRVLVNELTTSLLQKGLTRVIADQKSD
jgi:hypothetical protein